MTSAVRPTDVGEDWVIGPEALDGLVSALARLGYRVLGPVVRDGAVVHAEVTGTDQLPKGWHDDQGPGRYRLSHEGDDELFGWAVGPASWKSEFFKPHEVVWRAEMRNGAVTFDVPSQNSGPLALVGARPCEVAALGILDRVLDAGEVRDIAYGSRRRGAFVVAVECGRPSATCFCSSMDSGPGAEDGFDLALTELLDGPHRFYTRIGTPEGAELLAEVDRRPAREEDRAARGRVLESAHSRMGRRMETIGLAELLARNLEHPRWDDVAERCLSCGNCTLVCPTCFCSDVKDVSDLGGVVERRRTWSSCFDVDHSYIHGGATRPTTSSRYRQWMTHKLSTWWDQFDTSGCVGCGRCITWCPVGIDITEEAAAIRADDGAGARGEENAGPRA